MRNQKAVTSAQTAVIVVAILVIAAGGAYALTASTPPRTIVQTQMQTQTQVQTQVQTITQVQQLKPVSLLLSFIPGPRFAHYYVAKAQGFYADEGLDVTIIKGQGGVFSASQVDAKRVEFADTGTSNVYLTNTKTGKIRTVLLYQDTDPTAIATWKDKNVKTPKDLEGLRFVSAPQSGIIPALKALMPVYGASFDKVLFTPVDGAVQRPLFLKGDADFIPSFWENDKPVLEREAAKEGREVVHYLLADWGYKIYGVGVAVHVDTIKENRDLVERFVRATIKGLNAMKANPEMASDAVLRFEPGLDKEILIKGIANRDRLDSKDFKVTDERIKETMDFIKKWFNPERELAPDEIWDFSFVQKR